jgi:hypothetical protein
VWLSKSDYLIPSGVLIRRLAFTLHRRGRRDIHEERLRARYLTLKVGQGVERQNSLLLRHRSLSLRASLRFEQ